MRIVKNLNTNGVQQEYYSSHVKPPKRPPLDENYRCIRHVPRNNYNLVTLDALQRYLYKYQFDRFCSEYRIILETPDGKKKKIALEVYDEDTESYKEKRFNVYRIIARQHYSAILELSNVLYNVMDYNYRWADFYGFPVKRAGVVCEYNDEDEFFITEITLRFLDSQALDNSTILTFTKGI
jgi:hypothetical protein